MRLAKAAALALAFFIVGSAAEARVHRDLSREFTSEGRYSGGAPALEGRHAYRSKKRRTHRSVERSKPTRTLAPEARTIGGYAQHIRNTASVSDLVSPLAAKVIDINRICGSKLISAHRPGARVRGSGRSSLHAVYPSRAADLAGNPECIRSATRGWPGGMSTDYSRVKHYHLSYEPRGREWGRRFVHRKIHRHYARAQ